MAYAGISLGMRPANERRRFNVTTSLIDPSKLQSVKMEFKQLEKVFLSFLIFTLR